MRIRRSLLALGVVVGALVGFAPGEAVKADHCGRVLVMTGNQAVVYDPSTNFCSGATHQDMRRILPGADHAVVRVKKTANQPPPVSATLETPSKVVELDLKGNGADDESSTQYESAWTPIGSAAKVTVAVNFADGTNQTTTYTR